MEFYELAKALRAMKVETGGGLRRHEPGPGGQDGPGTQIAGGTGTC